MACQDEPAAPKFKGRISIIPIYNCFKKHPVTRLVPVMLFILTCALAYWISSFWTGQEDAYITYSYAKRIASGDGFVFSKGDTPVLGTTTPLYTLILAVFAVLGCPPHVSSPIIGIVCHGFVAVVIFFIVLHIFNHRLLAVGASLFWSFSLAVFFRTGGMETPFYLLLLSIFTLVEVRQPMSSISAILLGLMLLTTPRNRFAHCDLDRLLDCRKKFHLKNNSKHADHLSGLCSVVNLFVFYIRLSHTQFDCCQNSHLQ